MATVFKAQSVNSPRLRVANRFRLVGDPATGALIASAVDRVIDSGGSSVVVDRDAQLLRHVGATTVRDYRMVPLSFGGAGPVNGVWSSSNESVAVVDSLGYVSHVANGAATITFTAGEASLSRTLPFSTATGQTTDVLQGYMAGSVAKHVTDDVDGRLVGKSAATALRLFSVQNHDAGTYTRNPNVWCADWDLTCISPFNSTGRATRAGTLVSPRHIVFAAHYQIAVGATVRFVTMDGTVVDRIMTAKVTHPNYTPYYPDLTVGLLDSDVPEGISFARVLPDDWTDYVPALGHKRTLPALTLDQEEKALVTDWGYDTSSTGFYAPSDAKRKEFYETKVGGDSGNPAFIRVDGHLVLLTVWTYGGAGSGTSIRHQKTAINAMMAQLGGTYQLVEADLTGFTDFS